MKFDTTREIFDYYNKELSQYKLAGLSKLIFSILAFLIGITLIVIWAVFKNQVFVLAFELFVMILIPILNKVILSKLKNRYRNSPFCKIYDSINLEELLSIIRAYELKKKFSYKNEQWERISNIFKNKYEIKFKKYLENLGIFAIIILPLWEALISVQFQGQVDRLTITYKVLNQAGALFLGVLIFKSVYSQIIEIFNIKTSKCKDIASIIDEYILINNEALTVRIKRKKQKTQN